MRVLRCAIAAALGVGVMLLGLGGVISPWVLAGLALLAAFVLPWFAREVVWLLVGGALVVAVLGVAWSLSGWQCASDVRGELVVHDCAAPTSLR